MNNMIDLADHRIADRRHTVCQDISQSRFQNFEYTNVFLYLSLLIRPVII